MLAMVANDNAGGLTPRVVLGFIASMLARNARTTRAFRQPTSSLTSIASMLAPTGFNQHQQVNFDTRPSV